MRMNISFTKGDGFRARRRRQRLRGAILVLLATLVASRRARAARHRDAGGSAQGPVTALPRETAVENPLGRGGVLQGSAFGGYGELTLNGPASTAGFTARGDRRPAALRALLRPQLQRAPALLLRGRGRARHLVGRRPGRGRDRAGVPGRPVRPALQPARRPDPDAGRHHQRLSRAADVQRRRSARGRHLRHPLDLARGRRRHLRRDRATGCATSSIWSTASTRTGSPPNPPSRDGHQEAQLAPRGDFGGVARLDFEPRLGTIIGVSALLRDLGQHPARHRRQGAGQPVRDRRAHALWAGSPRAPSSRCCSSATPPR